MQPGEEEGDGPNGWMNDLMTTVFVEQPLELPGSAKYQLNSRYL